jgi:cysteine-rich repeat protein
MLRTSFKLTPWLWILCLAAAGCGGKTGDETCSPGSAMCDCGDNYTCDPGLRCLYNLCFLGTGGSSSPWSYVVAGTTSIAGGVAIGGFVPVTGGAANTGTFVYVGAGTVSFAGHATTGGAPVTGGAPNVGGVPSTGGKSGCYPTIDLAIDAGPNCGDGKVDIDHREGCDDGNLTSGDGCSVNCQVEPNWNCPVACAPCTITVVCGNGVVQPGEACDDGNTNSGDGCDSNCNQEPGWVCPVPNKACQLLADCGVSCSDAGVCGDGVVQAPETCDDGVNEGSYGGCTPDCQKAPFCGDGAKNGNEQCDYGSENAPPSNAPYGSCLINCQLGPHCGDSLVQKPPEECDDGPYNGSANSRCTASCKEYQIGPL